MEQTNIETKTKEIKADLISLINSFTSSDYEKLEYLYFFTKAKFNIDIVTKNGIEK